LIKIEGLSKSFQAGFFMQDKPALKNLSLNVGEGDVYGFIGPNGAGKSTTIKILLGLLRYTNGNVSVLGKTPSDFKNRAYIGYLPEHPYFYDYLSGYELVVFYGQLLGYKGKELRQRVESCLEKVHANKDWIHRKLRGYSKGMMQRVGLAQAILNTPKLLILDEPMSGLDPVGRKDVRDIILSLNKEGTTIFYSSHVLADVEAISNRVGIIIGGKIEKQGSISSILNDDDVHYRIQFSQNLTLDDFAIKNTLFDKKFILCSTHEAKNELLNWGQSQGLDLEHFERVRPSLEDILTKEIARHG
jgi:ABC-2 type transport system ATP-binding protein